MSGWGKDIAQRLRFSGKRHQEERGARGYGGRVGENPIARARRLRLIREKGKP